jgi:lipoprotein signal peptidase
MIKKTLKFLYPLAFGIFPAFSLYLHNYFQIEFFRVERALLVSTLLVLLLELLFLAIFRKGEPARVMTSLIIIVLMNYGAIFSFLNGHPLFGVDLSRIRYLLSIVVILLAVVTLLLIRKKTVAVKADQYGSWFAGGLVIVLLFNFASLQIQSIKQQTRVNNVLASTSLQTAGAQPNIYYIIMDGYTSSQALMDDFGYDNSGFENQLKDLGFTIPSFAYSNYDETVGSLSSILNMDWVQNLVSTTKPDPHKLALTNILVNSQVRSDLQARGYKTFSFENEFRWALWGNADFYLSPRNRNPLTGSLNSFEVILLKNSVARLFINNGRLDINQMLEDLGYVNLDKYNEQNYILQELPKLPDYIQPKFVFAHTTITHVPYVFNLDGSVMPGEYQGSNNEANVNDPKIQQGYIISIQYVNKMILPIVKSIIEKDPNAIIILQGDHGYPGKDRHQIFMAVHDPKNSLERVQCMTPVNLFRLIFNKWFGTNYPLLSNDLYKTLPGDEYQYEFIGTCESAIVQ